MVLFPTCLCPLSRQTQMILLNRLSSLILGNLEKFFFWWGGVVTRWFSSIVLIEPKTLVQARPNLLWIFLGPYTGFRCLIWGSWSSVCSMYKTNEWRLSWLQIFIAMLTMLSSYYPPIKGHCPACLLCKLPLIGMKLVRIAINICICSQESLIGFV